MAKERAGEPKEHPGLGEIPAVSRPRPAAKAPPSEPSAAGKTAPAPKTDRGPEAHDIGIDVPKPAKACDDRHCPFHGALPVRGQTFEGIAVSTQMQRTAVVERPYMRYIRKYQRYEKRTERFQVHNPPCLELNEGDRVVFMECRPIAKTVSFVAIQNKGTAS